MPWKETNAMEQREEFIRSLLGGKWSMTELCERYGVSRVTGHKWRNRFFERGLPGLEELPRAPRSCPHRTPLEIEEALVELKRKYTKWGPVTLLELLREQRPDWDLPAASTAGDILKRHGLVKPRERPRRPRHPGKPYLDIGAPNDVWTADFKGEFNTRDRRKCYPLTVADGFSRFVLDCHGLPSTAHDATKKRFTRAFREYGLPYQILTDNGVPFSTQGLCGLSRLSVWWIKLGIHPVRIEPGQPSQNGRHERMHRTLKREAISPPAANIRKQNLQFDEFRERFNTVRPHRALGLKKPAQVYEPSPRKMPKRLGHFDYPYNFMVRKVHGHGCFLWHTKHIFASRVLINERIGLEPVEDGIWSVYLGPVLLARFDERDGRLYP